MTKPLICELDSTNFKLKEVFEKKNQPMDLVSSSIKNLSSNTFAESKAFHYYPLDLVSTTGVKLARIAGLLVSYVRALDQTTGLITCYEVCAFWSINYGWNPGTQPPFIVLSKSNAGANLERWVTGIIVTKCGDNGTSRYLQKEFRPDYFDILVEPEIYVDGGGIWYKCEV